MGKNTSSIPYRESLEVLLVINLPEAVTRAKVVLEKDDFASQHLSLQQIKNSDLSDYQKAQVVVVVQEERESLSDFSRRVDEMLITFSSSQCVAVMSSGYSRDNLEGTPNGRVTALSHEEFYGTLKFTYLCFYYCRGLYFVVPLTDFFPMTKMRHNTYSWLNLNKKFLPVIQNDTILTDEKFSKLSEGGPLYVHCSDAAAYAAYVNEYYDRGGTSSKKRARSIFIQINYMSLLLNEAVLFDFKSTSKDLAQNLYAELVSLCEQLISVISMDTDFWQTFFEEPSSEFEVFWRSPRISVYAALISLRSGMGNPLNTLVCGLLMDVGLFDLEEDLVSQFLLKVFEPLESSRQSEIEKHPLLSLNRTLLKELPITEEMKSIIVRSHENSMGVKDSPAEAQILKLAELLDRQTAAVQKSGFDFESFRERFIQSPAIQLQFDPEFLDKASKGIK